MNGYTAFTPEFVREAVGRGFDMLTREQRDTVSIALLDMGDGALCILGQIFEDYAHGVEELLGVEFNTYECDVVAEAHGFYVDGRYNSFTNYALIQREWIRRLELEREITELLKPVGSF